MPLTLGGVLVALLALVFGGGLWPEHEPASAVAGAGTALETPRAPESRAPAHPGLTRAAPEADPAAQVRNADVGFRSRAALDDHFQKHGGEFGGLDRAGYLLRAQALRDRPVGQSVFQKVRGDGVVTRFDTASGEFIAFDADLTIRTFFKPEDGWRYFERQASRDHE